MRPICRCHRRSTRRPRLRPDLDRLLCRRWCRLRHVEPGQLRPVGGVPVTAQTTNGGKGWFGQGQVGCDYQFASPIFDIPLVVGGFGDYAGGSISGTSDFPGVVGAERNPPHGRLAPASARSSRPAFSPTLMAVGPRRTLTRSTTTSPCRAADRPASSLAAQTYNGWFIGSGFEYSLDWLPDLRSVPQDRISLCAIFRGRECSFRVVFRAASSGVTLNSQKTTQLISTELVWRFNWFGR